MGRESASGLISGIDVVNAAQRFTHTPFGELATYRSQGAGGNVLDVALTYDALARIVDKVENGAAWHYDYDVRGRLTRARKNGADVATYAYDANGNRVDGAAVIDAQDRVLSMNGATYTYSAAGERLTRTTGAGVTTYLYDGRGHLSSVTAPSGVRADYDLDAYGRRVTKRRNGTVQNASSTATAFSRSRTSTPRARSSLATSTRAASSAPMRWSARARRTCY